MLGRFSGALGPRVEISFADKAAIEGGSPNEVHVFDDATGRTVDMGRWGSTAEFIEGRLGLAAGTFARAVCLASRAPDHPPSESEQRNRHGRVRVPFPA